MNTGKNIQLNKAVQKARLFGFTTQLTLVNGEIKKMSSTKNYQKHEFAIVKSYPINFLNNKIATIDYIVLSDGTLGYLLKEKNILNALETVTKEQECSTLSAKYVKGNDLRTHKRLFDNTKQLIEEIIYYNEQNNE